MNKFDGRKLDHKTREAIRKRAVQRILDGESPEVIAKTLGYHRSAVYQWLKRYAEGGIEGLTPAVNSGHQRYLYRTIFPIKLLAIGYRG